MKNLKCFIFITAMNTMILLLCSSVQGEPTINSTSGVLAHDELVIIQIEAHRIETR